MKRLSSSRPRYQQAHEAGAASRSGCGGADGLHRAVVAEDGLGDAGAAPTRRIERGVVLHGEDEAVSHRCFGALVDVDAFSTRAESEDLRRSGAVEWMLTGGKFKQVGDAVAVRVLVVFVFAHQLDTYPQNHLAKMRVAPVFLCCLASATESDVE